jgi:hypothetical protein
MRKHFILLIPHFLQQEELPITRTSILLLFWRIGSKLWCISNKRMIVVSKRMVVDSLIFGEQIYLLLFQHSWLLKVLVLMSLDQRKQAAATRILSSLKYVTRLKQMGGGDSCEWRCNLCNNGKIYKGSYTRVKIHNLHKW